MTVNEKRTLLLILLIGVGSSLHLWIWFNVKEVFYWSLLGRKGGKEKYPSETFFPFFLHAFNAFCCALGLKVVDVVNIPICQKN